MKKTVVVMTTRLVLLVLAVIAALAYGGSKSMAPRNELVLRRSAAPKQRYQARQLTSRMNLAP